MRGGAARGGLPAALGPLRSGGSTRALPLHAVAHDPGGAGCAFLYLSQRRLLGHGIALCSESGGKGEVSGGEAIAALSGEPLSSRQRLEIYLKRGKGGGGGGENKGGGGGGCRAGAGREERALEEAPRCHSCARRSEERGRRWAARPFLLSLPKERTGRGGRRGNGEPQGRRRFLAEPNRRERPRVTIGINYYSPAARGMIRASCGPRLSPLPLLSSPPPFFIFLFFFFFLLC